MPSTYANGRSIQHKGDGNQHIGASPDVCKTPSPGGPVPIPYVNIAMNSNLTKGAKTVKIEGNMSANKGSYLSTSTGDEPGTAGGGIISSKTKGKLKWVSNSMNVKFEGKGVIRFMEPSQHNANAGNGFTATKGNSQMVYPGAEGECPRCGEPMAGHDYPEMNIESSKESVNALNRAKEDARRNQRATMAGALVINCGGNQETISALAGPSPPNWLSQGNFASEAKSVFDGSAITPDAAQLGSNNPGNCSEQKMIRQAHKRGLLPLKKGCTANMSVGEIRGKQANRLREACTTCKHILLLMLCKNPPKTE